MVNKVNTFNNRN